MASTLVRELLDAGIHFGHRCSRWNPKMAPYIYGKRNSIHIIDIRETLRGLLRAKKFISRLVSKGGDVLFVGTKRQARELVQRHAERCGMHYVSERWLGGTLTNFRTIRSRLQRLEELEALVASPQWETGYSKKMKSTLSRELHKILRNLSGIREMNRLPGAVVVIDVRKEVNALREARALEIPTICLLDTDSDPDLVDIPIPGNDDAMRGIDLIMRQLTGAAEEGRKARPEPAEAAEKREGPATGGMQRRPRRRIPEGGRREAQPAPAEPQPAAPPTEAPAPEAVATPAASAPETANPAPAPAAGAESSA
ncbi:MAG: 30S ribosomal protein S2 [Phycisphaerae bacterium]|nr:30S ribosomal protein S2 [Phycisphaerae bacterium]